MGSGVPIHTGHANTSGMDHETENARMRKDLADAEFALKPARGWRSAGHAGQAAFEAEIRSLKAANEDQGAELAKVKRRSRPTRPRMPTRSARQGKQDRHACAAQCAAGAGRRAHRNDPEVALEMAAANEKLARQAQHFMEEMPPGAARYLRPAPAAAGRRRSRPIRWSSASARRVRRRELRAAGKSQRQAEDPMRVSGGF